MSHKKQVLVMTAGELLFLVPGVLLYIFLVLPNHPDGELPGLIPLIGGPGVLLSLLAAAGIFAVALALSVTLFYFFGDTLFRNDEVMTLVSDFSVVDFIPIYVAAGLGEEALFRLALMEPCGLVVTSLLFTAVHIAYWKKPLVMAYVFMSALLLGVLFLYTQSFFLCALVHALFNFTESVLLKRQVIKPHECDK